MRTAAALGVSSAALAVFIALAAGSLGDSGPTAPATDAAVTLRSATVCKGLDADHRAVDPTTSFDPTETLYLGAVVAGRPTSGTVKAEFIHRERVMAEAAFDLAEVNGGVVVSLGQDTFLGFDMRHTEALPVGVGYHIDLSYDGEALGSYPFTVNRPPDSTHGAAWRDGGLTRSMTADGPGAPVQAFGPGEPIFVYGLADLGVASWVQIELEHDGKPVPAATQYRVGEKNVVNAGVSFEVDLAHIQPGSWEVAVIGDGAELARYPFTVGADAP